MKKKIEKSESNKTKDVLERMDAFFGKHEKVFLRLSLILAAIMSFLMFDCKVSLSGDDSDYIINAQQFIKHFTYPGSRGALYPIVISPFLIFGLNLILIKSLSAVFMIVSMWLIYKSFRAIVPYSVLMPALLLSSICPHIFFYASYTYSEPFFMIVQALFIYLITKYFRNTESSESLHLKTDWKKFLYIGLCFLAMGLTRTIGYSVMGAVILYLCFLKQWKNLFYSLASGGIFYGLFAVIKKVVWPESGAAYSIINFLAKNHYNPEQGLEDLPGYINRLIVNSNGFLSDYLYRFMGFRSPNNMVPEGIPLLTIFTYILFAVCIIFIYKKNRPLLFVGLYTGTMLFVSFILLQTIWLQDRFIMIYYTLILMFFFGGFYYIIKKIKSLSFLYPLILIAILIGTGIHFKVKVEKNLPVLQQNLLGNDLYGLTPDWENFVKMSRWTNEHLDKNAVIASRKPSISYIYTGREFFGIYTVTSEPLPDAVKQIDDNADKFNYIAIDITKGFFRGFENNIRYFFITRLNGNFTIDGNPIKAALFLRIDKSEDMQAVTNILNDNNVLYTLDYKTFLKQYIDDKSAQYQVIDPDVLLKTITDNDVKYMILPKIRLYTAENTGYYINTLHQYVNFINAKYPDSFRNIHTIGKEETCDLYEFFGTEASVTEK